MVGILERDKGNTSQFLETEPHVTQGFSTWGIFARHLAISRDVFGCRNWGRVGGGRVSHRHVEGRGQGRCKNPTMIGWPSQQRIIQPSVVC